MNSSIFYLLLLSSFPIDNPAYYQHGILLVYEVPISSRGLSEGLNEEFRVSSAREALQTKNATTQKALRLVSRSQQDRRGGQQRQWMSQV